MNSLETLSNHSATLEKDSGSTWSKRSLSIIGAKPWYKVTQGAVEVRCHIGEMHMIIHQATRNHTKCSHPPVPSHSQRPTDTPWRASSFAFSMVVLPSPQTSNRLLPCFSLPWWHWRVTLNELVLLAQWVG